MKCTIAGTMWTRLRGLHAAPFLEGSLLLVPCSDIHTFGMRKAIDAAFLDAHGYVMASFSNVAPNKRIHIAHASAVLERWHQENTDRWPQAGENISLVFEPNKRSSPHTRREDENK